MNGQLHFHPSQVRSPRSVIWHTRGKVTRMVPAVESWNFKRPPAGNRKRRTFQGDTPHIFGDSALMYGSLHLIHSQDLDSSGTGCGR
jgi:hypothetical protein